MWKAGTLLPLSGASPPPSHDLRNLTDAQASKLFRKESLEITEEDRPKIRTACEESSHRQILITHGADTMAKTAEELLGLPGKITVRTGAMAPARFRITDALFTVGAAVGALQSLTAGVYLAMNGRIFEAGTVRKNREARRFEKL